MKKTLVMPLLAALAVTSLIGCNKKTNKGDGKPADPLDLGEQFNADYYPKKEDNNVANIVGKSSSKMKIDIAINFEDTEDAWEAVAKEYERLCGNLVEVKLVTGLDTNAYTERIRNEEVNPNTDWDIVQGNLMNSPESHAVDLRSTVQSSKNPYAGNRTWVDLLEEEAYITDTSGATDFCYYLNSENLSTAWFINTEAAANAAISDTTPETWDELIEILEAMQQAGYKYPLGLTLSKDGIEASQFSWLLRVYGDYFFRDNYIHTSKSFDPINKVDPVFTYDPTAENIEASSSFSFSINRCLATMLDSSCEFFVGPTSDKYNDFLYQIGRLAKYIKPSAYSLSFNEVRTSFMAQADGNNGDEAPQVILDYSGEGLAFLNAPKLKNSIDYFDYPTIVSDQVPEGTITRDVGGNGGYLALLHYHNKKQTDLNKDFLKYFLSPYGQSIYYKALSEKGKAPKGLTTVKNDLVLIPNEWKEFFQTDKISFTGLADNNSHLNEGAYRFFTSTRAMNKSVELWQKYMKPTGAITYSSFSIDLLETFISCYADIATEQSWPSDGYYALHFDDPNYIKS